MFCSNNSVNIPNESVIQEKITKCIYQANNYSLHIFGLYPVNTFI